MNCSQERFISDLVCKLKDLSFEDPQGPKTDRLNNEIADVAYNHKLCVWAKGLKDCKNPDNKAHISGHEWLYDLICFTYDEDEHYALNNTIMVMESEWKGKRNSAKGHDGNDPYGEVKYDFQKLLISNADIKLMVYLQHKEDKTYESLTQYFKKRIDNYHQGRESDIFLFVRYSHKKQGKRECLISSYTKSNGWEHLH